MSFVALNRFCLSCQGNNVDEIQKVSLLEISSVLDFHQASF